MTKRKPKSRFVVQSELTDQTLGEPGENSLLEPRSEERSRWLHYADLVLRHPKLGEILNQARQEQEAIKRKIHPDVEKFKRLKKLP